MAIANLAAYHASLRQRIPFTKTSVISQNVTSVWESLWQGAGTPGAGAGSGNTANGVVPTKATTGAIQFADFSGTGYLTAVEFTASIFVTRIALFDKLFSCGSYSLSSTTTLASQPSYSGRLPGGSYEGLQIWAEKTTTGTGVPTVTITYTNSQGVAGQTTGAQAIGAGNVARLAQQYPLAAGDTGVQKIESVVVGASGAGTVDVFVLRPLWTGVIDKTALDWRRHFMDQTGMPIVFTDSCLVAMAQCNSGTTLPQVDLDLEIASA